MQEVLYWMKFNTILKLKYVYSDDFLMKTYKDYIREGIDSIDLHADDGDSRENTKLFGNLLKLISELRFVTDRRGNYIDEFFDKLYDGKSIDRDIKKFDSIKNSIVDIVKKLEKFPRYKTNIIIVNNVLEKYNKIISGYKTLEKVYNTIFSYIKIGEKAEIAVPKLVKMTKTVKYFNIENFRYTTEYFDEYTEEEIYTQIERFKGTVKLNGAADLYVKFENGKVFKYWF